MSNKRRLQTFNLTGGISRGMSRRKLRRRSRKPIRNIDMIPEDATPEEAHRIEMRERRQRQHERSERGAWPLPTERPKPTTTNPSKVKAAAEKRERRRQRRLTERAQMALGNEQARRDMKNGITYRNRGTHTEIEFLDWTKKGAGRS